MMGETQHVYVTSSVESSAPDKEIDFEPFGKKDACGAFDGELLGGSEPCLPGGEENDSGFPSVKDKEPHHQREAVIRPQQAGKIDFKSLHNRSKFPGDSPWGAVKGSPPSPTGKSRARDRTKRAGKGERGHQQQLYRLTIGNARPNPTIGIAYPQQKVTPPKKVEFGRGPVSGSYRFHVPSVPEREAELQQEDRSFARCFPETPSSHIPGDYPSPTAAARLNHAPKMQPPVGVPHASPGSGGQLHYLEFQGSGSNSWHPLDKSLPGANSGLPPPKPCSFPENHKSNTHCLGPSSFQYPFPASHSPATDSFPGDADPQDYVNVSLAASPATHGAPAFHSSSRDWKEEALGNGPYEAVAPESRLYGLVSPLTQFLQSQTQGHVPSYKGRNEHSTDHTGAISPSGAIDQNPSTLQENQAVFPPSLHVSSMPTPIGKRHPSLKDNVASQRIADSGSLLRRNPPQSSRPQVHFQNKAYSDPPVHGLSSPASVPLEKNLSSTAQTQPRLLQAWEGGKRPYSPMEQNATLYPSPVGNQLSFGSHSGPEQRHHLKKTWQHAHLTSAMPNQNRIELSRKLAGPKLPFPPEWDESSKAHKTAPSYSGKVLLTGEGAVIQRHDPALQNCSSVNAFCFEGAKDADLPAGCGPRSKSLFFSMSQHEAASSRLPAGSTLVPPPALAASPSESPLPSPAPNPASGSTCSSLSPMSSSPSSHSFEDGAPLTTSPFFHQQSHPKDGNKPVHVSEPLCANSLHYHAADPAKAFHLSQEASKDDLLYKGVPMEGHFHKPNADISKGCLEGFETELPPPPYSSHHLLASSLSSASLDQLDVFLTCKQCDQNFSNLSSFFEHRQFCNSHMALQGQTKESSRGTEIRKQQHLPPNSGKHSQATLGPLLLPDPHLQLLALNKAIEFPADGEGKGESKEDPLKMNQMGNLSTNPLPLSASDLEIDDAKLDSLITEALNGLGYQSDNPEIDSSFIDVFADEELASVKVANGGASCKAKDGLALGKKMRLVGLDENVKMGSGYDEHPGGDLAKNRVSGKQLGPEERVGMWFPDHRGERCENQSSTETARSKAVDPATYDRVQINANAQLKIGRKSCCGSFPPVKQVTKTFSEPKQTKNVKSTTSPVSDLRPVGESSVAAGTAKLSAKDAKKQKLRSGTWSKELIHKIVQQKNKLHKLHTKSTKTVPLSLLADRLLPETKDSKFGEYEYISESDDERVEYAKRHCRRKLGSRFGGRPRSGFGRRHQGRGGREKEKEPAWSHGQRTDRDEPKRALGKEAGRKDNRRRSRSNRSSTSSCQSTTFSSETSVSPQSTERADSDTEKESDAAGPRKPLNVPKREARERSHTIASDFSGEPDHVSAARILPPDVKACQNDSPNVPPVGYTHGDEGLRRAKETLHRSKTTLDNSPAVLFGSDHAEQYNGRSSHDEDKQRAASKTPEPCELGIEQRWLQFTAYNGRYHGEELTGPSSLHNNSLPMDENALYAKMESKHLEKQKEFIAPISCFSDNPVGLGVAENGLLVNTADTFYDCKELSSSYESPSLFSGSPAIESSHSDNVYLCQGDLNVDPFKPKHPAISPYEADQSKPPSPLSFDSSSVFGDIPVADFDTTLYDGVSSGKESYVPFPCAAHPLGKMTFDQQYSPFLQEKDWNPLVDVSPVLPEDLAPFHSLSVEKPLAKRFPGEISQMPLPERIANYNEPFLQSISDDDLEIKRLVTELESQLQTSKPTLEASEGHQTPKPHTVTEQKESVNQFSPLTLGQQSNGNGLFLVEGDFENAGLLSTKACLCEHSANEKTLLPNLETKFGSHHDLWPCSVQFSPLQPTMNVPSSADLMLVGPFSPKESHVQLHEDLTDAEICGEDGFLETSGASTGILPESDNREVPSYTEHLIRSPDPLFPKTVEAAELNIHETLPLEADGFPELQPEEKIFDGTAELEAFGHQDPCLKPEFGLQEVCAPGDDGTQHAEDPGERPLSKASEKLEMRVPIQRDEAASVLLEKAEETESAADCTSPTPGDQASNGKTLLFESLPCSKEAERGAEYALVPQRKSANPLQQLQLFVARTVKSNEEDLLLPCFPVLHSAALVPTSANVQPEEEEGAADGMLSADVVASPAVGERKGSVGDGSGSKASDSAEPCLEADERAGEEVSPVAEPPVLQGPEQPSVPEQPLKEESSAVADVNRCTDGLSSKHGNLSLLSGSVVTSLPREEGTQGAQVTGEQKKVTLAFRSRRKSPLSPGSLQQDTAGQDLSTALHIQVTHCATWAEAGSQGQALRLVTTRQMEQSGDLAPQDTPSASAGASAHCYPDSHPLHKTGFCAGTNPGLTEGSQGVGTSRDGFPAQPGFADQKCKRDDAAVDGPLSDFRELASQDRCCLATPSQSQSVRLHARRYSSDEEKGAIRSPAEHEEWKDVLPFTPVLQHYTTVSPVLLGVLGGLQQCLAEGTVGALAKPPKDVLIQPASSRCLDDPAAPLAETESPLKLQSNSGPSPNVSSFTHKGLSEGLPKSPGCEDSDTLSARDVMPSSPSVSLQGVFLGPSPSETSSGQHREEEAKETSIHPRAKEAESCSPEVSKDDSPQDVFRKDVGIQESPATDLSKTANAEAGDLRTNHFPDAGCSHASQNMDSRGKAMKREGCEPEEQMEDSSSPREREESQGGNPKEDSNMGQPNGKGLQIACAICSVSFRSKTGLMRHRAVKHQEKKGCPPFLSPGLGPSRPAPKRNVKSSVKERVCSPHIPRTAAGQVVARAYRNRRKEPNPEMQEVVSRVLSDLSVISCDITHELQSINRPSSGGRETTVARVDGSIPRSRKGPKAGGKEGEAKPVGSGGFAEKKLRRKGEKAKARGDPNQDKVVGSSCLHDEALEVHAEGIPGTANRTRTVSSKEQGNDAPSTKAQAKGQSSLLPHPLVISELEADERKSSAKERVGEHTHWGAGSSRGEGAECPALEEKLHTQDSWRTGFPKQAEKQSRNLCEEQHGTLNAKEAEAKESALEEASCRNHDGLFMLTLSPQSQQQPSDSQADPKGSTEESSEKAAEGASPPISPKPWGTGDRQPSHESCTDGPDLPNLFDDDATFSQLFPRNEEFARRKCTRVYGKRTKKLAPVAEVKTRTEGTADLFTIRMPSDLGENSSFYITRDDPCEYETISANDTLMLNMCHGNKTTPNETSSSPAKNVALQPDARQREEPADLTAEGPLLSSSAELHSGASGMEASPEPPHLEEEPCDARRNKPPILPEFHTIDMEMLNAKFEMKMPYYHAEEEPLHHPEASSLGLKPMPAGQGEPIKNKLEEGKQGKPRSDLNLKTKEKQYKCKVCFQWFLTLGELDFHKLTHNPSPPPTCYMCVQRKFSSREQLRDHLKEKHAKNKAGLWACGMCLKEISDVWMYNEHLREHATQFARKGQAQKSVLGMPGCFGEDNVAVTHFLNSILCRKPSKSSKNVDPGSKALVCKGSKIPKEPQGQERKVSKDPFESLVRVKAPAASPKVPSVSSPDPAPKIEGPPKMVPMHPECKDPSRDCHHCGKQFPKPFKLQRHLVVHSLQKIYLCHKCPVFYQETKELRSHLSQEHGTAEETEIKHTTLYACELCADVMHVIKKSFICSTCNYTFSKKEQYDRHMEKHLVGSDKTFRFRGVLRPGVVPKGGDKKIKEELRPREGGPAAKKKKVLHHTGSLPQDSPVHLDCLHFPQLEEEALFPPREPLSPAATTTSPPPTPVKIEDRVGDHSGLLAEAEQSQLVHLPSPPPLAHQQASDGPEVRHMAEPSVGQLAKGGSPDEIPPLFSDSPDPVSIDLAGLAHKQTEAQKLSPPHLSEKHKQADVSGKVTFHTEADHPMAALHKAQIQEDPMSTMLELSAKSLGVAECKGTDKTQWIGYPNPNETVPQESAFKLHAPEAAFHSLPLKDKTSSPALNRSTKDVPCKKVTSGQADTEKDTNTQNSSVSTGEVQKPSCLKDKASPEMGPCPKDSRAQVGVKDTGTIQGSPMSGHLRSETGGIQVRHNHSEASRFQDRPLLNGLAKLLPKKRREHKSSHKGSSASRENIEGEGGKKKKVRVLEATKGDTAGSFKRADWSNSEALALSPRRGDTHCNKLTPKPKMSTTSGQLKKMVLDQCFQKKVEIRHSNGDLKRKKEVLGKTYHPLLAKDPSTSLASSLNRHRAVRGAKLPDAHHYRTAESQNNLLSQLFGQKLTSFKIPLRRDTSE